jgi:hypothetical protein
VLLFSLPAARSCPRDSAPRCGTASPMIPHSATASKSAYGAHEPLDGKGLTAFGSGPARAPQEDPARPRGSSKREVREGSARRRGPGPGRSAATAAATHPKARSKAFALSPVFQPRRQQLDAMARATPQDVGACLAGMRSTRLPRSGSPYPRQGTRVNLTRRESGTCRLEIPRANLEGRPWLEK